MLTLLKPNIDKKQLRHLDLIIIGAIIVITLFSLVNIYGATGMTSHYSYLIKQIIYIIIGFIAIYALINVDYNIIAKYSTILYVLNIALLLVTLFKGTSVNGAKAWIKLGSFSLEPGEFLKITLNLILAKKISDMNGEINKPKNILILMMYCLIPMALLMKQPDLGVTLICFSIVLGIVFIGGIDLRTLVIGLIFIAILGQIAWNSNLIKDYQKSRITAFLNQDSDPLGAGLQLKQSKIAIGSGGITGEGFLQGNQVNKGVIPEDHTDFIFAVIGEEWGLIGGVSLLALYSVIILRIIKISKEAKDSLGALFCVGIACELLFSILQNIGMTIGLMPISGITLPFISYGGSSVLSNCIALGIILSIGVRRKKLNF